jgi:tetratricopeptide (TPR) repeat protein
MLSPANIFASLEDVKTAVLQEDFVKTKALCEEALLSSAGSEEEHLLYYLALSQLYLGENEKARGNFQKIVDGTKDMDLYDQASAGVISSYDIAGDYREALKRSHQLLLQRPESNYLSLVYLKIARANLKLRNWEPARRYLKKIMADFPDSLEAYTAKQLLEEKQFFTVQVGAFLDQERAQKLMEELKNSGHYGYMVQTEDKKGNKFYRVRVGELSSLDTAKKLKEKLSSLGYPTLIYP